MERLRQAPNSRRPTSKGAVAIAKAGKTTGGAPTGKFRVGLGGYDGAFKATMKANGTLVIRVPELAKQGLRSLKVTYLGDDLHPRTTRKFALRVVR